MPYTVTVDKDVCISSGKCVADAPEVFRFDDDEIAGAVSERPGAPDAVLLDLAKACPSGAIVLRDEQGEEVEVY